jgi:hypothetical protein
MGMKRLLFILIPLLFIGCSNEKAEPMKPDSPDSNFRYLDKTIDLWDNIYVFTYNDRGNEYLVFIYRNSITVIPRQPEVK